MGPKIVDRYLPPSVTNNYKKYFEKMLMKNPPPSGPITAQTSMSVEEGSNRSKNMSSVYETVKNSQYSYFAILAAKLPQNNRELRKFCLSRYGEIWPLKLRKMFGLGLRVKTCRDQAVAGGHGHIFRERAIFS